MRINLTKKDLVNLIYMQLGFSKKIAEALKKAVDCQRIGISVIGLEVPHVHVHLIPINKMDDMSFNSKIKLSDDQFVDIMEKIKSYL